MLRLSVFLVSSVLLLSGCSRVELASHLAKQALPGSQTTASAGYFKVGNPYKIDGRWYYPQESYDLVETGIASWYGPNFHGKQTANGEVFDKYELTAAHRTLQMPSLVRVTNLENGRSLIVRVNDRGPYKRGRIIDLSEKAAELLGYKGQGTAKVKLQVLKEESMQIASAAKSGRDTSGFEVAANRGQPLPGTRTRVAIAQPQQPVSPYKVASLENVAPPTQQPVLNNEAMTAVSGPTPNLQPVERDALKTAIPGHEKAGEFYPDPVLSEYPVTKTSIFVQAGSFSDLNNARSFGDRLEKFNHVKIETADVNNTTYYRVRLGPVQSVDMADRLLAMLVEEGVEEPLIVVE